MASYVLLGVVAMVTVLVTMSTGERSGLLIIDVQNCFTSGGSLEVEEGDEVIPVINRLRESNMFLVVMLSQDWHCSDHISFASQHPGKEISDVVTLRYNSDGVLCPENATDSCLTVVEQVLWPDHCIINTTDAAFRHNLTTEPEDIVVRKGYNCDLDSYSVFYDNGAVAETGARALLQEAGVTDLYITGLAQDYCVYWSAKDALQLGFETYVVVDATRPVDKETGDAAIEDMEKLGIHIITSTALLSATDNSAVSFMSSLTWTLCIGTFLLQSWISS